MATNAAAPDLSPFARRVVERLGRMGRRRRGALPGGEPALTDEPGVTTLDQLGHGQAGRVVRVGGRPAVRRRLLELGIVRGETMTLQRAAPLGDPLEFLVKGYHLSLRAREAAAISIEVVDGTALGDTPAGDEP